MKGIIERVNEWLSVPLKIVKLVINEIKALIALLIVGWPNTLFGYKMRGRYWRKMTGVKNILVGDVLISGTVTR